MKIWVYIFSVFCTILLCFKDTNGQSHRNYPSVPNHYVEPKLSPDRSYYAPYSYPGFPKTDEEFRPQTSCESPLGTKGVCRTSSGCETDGGIADGICPRDSRAVCCVKPSKCNERSKLNNTMFTNAEYPQKSTAAQTCSLHVKLFKKTSMVKLVFHKFELAPPDSKTGKCDIDKFVVSGPIMKTMFEAICGDNNGQHVWIPVNPQIAKDLQLTIVTSNNKFSRIWKITVDQFSEGSFVPHPICTQYFTGLNGVVSSFNSDSSTRIGKGNIDGLNYAVCFEKKIGYCSIELNFVYLQMSGGRLLRRRRAPVPESSSQVSISKELLEKLMRQAEFMKQMKSSSAQPSVSTPPTTKFPLFTFPVFTMPPPVTFPPITFPVFTKPPLVTFPPITFPPITLPPINIPQPVWSCVGRDTILASKSDRNEPICSDNTGLKVELNAHPFLMIVSNRGNPHGRGFSLDYTYKKC